MVTGGKDGEVSHRERLQRVKKRRNISYVSSAVCVPSREGRRENKAEQGTLHLPPAKRKRVRKKE